jgi:hypothetical protein
VSENVDSLLHTLQVNFSIKSLKSGFLPCTQLFTLIPISTAPKCERVILVSILFNVIELIEGGMVNLGLLNTSHCVFINICDKICFITTAMINHNVQNSCFYVVIFCLRQRRFNCNIEGRSCNHYCCGKQ